MKWSKRILIVLAVLLVMAVVLPLVIPVNAYIPQIEKAASDRLKQPVTIKELRLGLLPSPHVTLNEITAGNIRLGQVSITPDLYSLMQQTKVIRSVDIDALILDEQGIGQILAIANQPASAPAQIRVENIRLHATQLHYGKPELNPFDAHVRLDDKGQFEQASIATQDDKLKAVITPHEAGYRVELNAKAWTLPLDPALEFDELSIKGIMTPGQADLNDISARLYGGSVSGKTSIRWDKGLVLNGKLDIRQVEMKKIASMLSPGAHVSGKLSATPVFSASAASADQLKKALRLETRFNVQNGIIHGVDIQKAAANPIKKGASGGETRFDQLSGHLAMAHGGYRFTQLKVASGLLAVDGDVAISPAKALSGRINAQVKVMGASAATVPLNVAGTTDSPSLYPTKGAMAGAAVGTAILGPGLGTSLGAKIGGWAESLFGKKDEKPPAQKKP